MVLQECKMVVVNKCVRVYLGLMPHHNACWQQAALCVSDLNLLVSLINSLSKRYY